MVDTVGIVGLGLIGGSLARRLTERGTDSAEKIQKRLLRF